jgi:hypothetical protein
MGRLLTILGGLGAGAALMYFMDPEKGRTRRTQVQDKFTGLSNDLRHNIEGRSKDLRNRAKGLLHEAKSSFGGNRGGTSAQGMGQMPSEHEGMGI